MEFDHFIDELAEFREHLLLVIAVTASIKQPWTASDKATILCRPFHNFRIVLALFHFLDSSTAALTALSW